MVAGEDVIATINMRPPRLHSARVGTITRHLLEITTRSYGSGR